MDGTVGGDASNSRRTGGTRLVISMAFTIVLSICACCIMGASANTPELVSVTDPSVTSTDSLISSRTAPTLGSTSTNPVIANPTSPNPSIINPATPDPTNPNPLPSNSPTLNATIPDPTSLNLTTSNPAAPNPTTPKPITPTPNPTIPNPAEPNPTSVNPSKLHSTPEVQSSQLSAILPTTEKPSTIGKTSKVAALVTLVAKTTGGSLTVMPTDLSKTTALPKDNASAPAGYVVETGTPASAARTEQVSAARTGNQSGVETTSGSESALTTAPPTSIVVVYETELVTELQAVDIATGNETVRYVTPNTTTSMAGGPGLDPTREKDDLKKLLLIIGCSIAVALVAILISFIIVYRVAKRRQKKKNSRYYNFKKKKTNYEKVLHLQEYHAGDLGNEAGTGTGAGWVFDEKETNKTITLEMAPKGKDKPDSRSARSKKSRNKNKNNRNKSVGRGNYQVLAEFFPAARRTTPPDALLTEEGAVYSNSIDNGGSGILDTSFGPLMVDDEKANWSETDDLSSKDSSLRDSMRLSWPSWNTSPYVTVTQEDTGVEL